MKWSSYYDEKTDNLKVGKVILTVFVMVVLMLALFFVVKLVFIPARTVAGILDTVTDSDYVLYNYEWFYNKYQTIEARRAQVFTAVQAHETWKESVAGIEWKYSEREENGRLQTIIQGLRYNLNELIADYNAKNSMVTREIFKGKDLPEKIELVIN